ncbi:MAG TPA: hypothetical protein VHC22_14225 [Pirellulales bacterium]|nr:hypothetical protein [Pirellulales bacterium]
MPRRFQFSLRAILAVTTVVAVSIATWPLLWEVLLGLVMFLAFPVILGSPIIGGYLLARLLWLLPDR